LIFTYIVGKVARGVLGDWVNRKHEYGQRQAQGFYKRPSGRKAEELLNLNQKLTTQSDGVINRTLAFKRMFILELVSCPECCRCRRAPEPVRLWPH
jgi:hypothetical protein